MSRKPIKTVSNEPVEFTPEQGEGLDPKAEKICDRPLIFVGKRMTRDQKYTLQELTKVEYPEGVDFSNEEEVKARVHITGRGKALKYVWDTCVKKAKNVMLDDKEYDEFEEMDKLWNTEGIDSEIIQTINFFMTTSDLDGEESKN